MLSLNTWVDPWRQPRRASAPPPRRSAARSGLTAAAVIFSAFALSSACSDDDTPGRSDAGSDGSTADMGSDGATGDASIARSIVDVASSNTDFSTLVAAVQRAGLVETLEGVGPFTVFAPTNQAFSDSGITDVNAVSVEDLRNILLYHVISGAKLMAADVTAGTAESAASLTLFVGTEGGVKLNGGNAVTGGANVTATDVAADNGVIHVIDRVLLPPDIATCATYGGLTSLVTAVGAAAALGDGTAVVDALKTADLTVFAPSNSAFAALGTAPEGAALRDVLLYHVVGSRVLSSAIPGTAPSLLQNRWNNPVTLLFNTSSGVKVNDATVTLADIKCTNGIVHVIDKVLLPPNVVQMATLAGLSSLVTAVGSAAPIGSTPVVDALQADQPYTVFAPTNAAFSAITPPSNPNTLRDVLLLHVITASAPVLSSGLPASPVETLLSGQSLTFNATGPTVSSGGTSGAAIGPADINVTNVSVR